MEDEGFVDDSFIEETAWKYVALHGGACLSVLRHLARSPIEPGMNCPRRRGVPSPKPPSAHWALNTRRGGSPLTPRRVRI
jgi:hypothetical protein